MQVHEKSILLPLMPLMLLGPQHPVISRWLPAVACFSMFPLLKKDSLTLAYCAVLMLWGAVAWPLEERVEGRDPGTQKELEQDRRQLRWNRLLGVCLKASVGLALGVHAAACLLEAPKRYPYIFDAMITSTSFVHIGAVAIYLQYHALVGGR